MWKEVERKLVEQLENGLRYVITSRPYSYTTAMKLVIFSGSRFDENKLGTAHLGEHVMFNSGKEMLKKIESMGGEVNVFTSKEFISIDVISFENRFKPIMECLYRIISEIHVDESMLEKEKKIVLSEIIENKNRINHWHELVINEIDYGHPYANPNGGTMESVISITVDDLTKYFKRHITGNNMAVLITGNVDYDEASKAIRNIFGSILPGEVRTNQYAEIKRKKLNKTIHIPMKMSFIHYVLAFPAVNANQRERISFELLRLMAYANESTISKAYKQLREYNQYQYSWNCVLQMGPDVGFMAITGKCIPEKFGVVQALFDKVTSDIVDCKISQDELEGAKNKLTGRVLNKLDNNEGMNNYILSGIICYQEDFDIGSYVNMIKEIRLEEIRDIIEKYMKDWRVWIVYGGNESTQ